MRFVFFSLSDLSIRTATKFIEEDHEVIMIDQDAQKIEKVSENLDCGFLVGDASRPKVLKECNPEDVDYFFALSDNNQNNLVACLIAQSLGIERTFLQIDDPEFETICYELGLKDVIMPSEINSQYLFDAISNENLLELFDLMKKRAGLYMIVASDEEIGGEESLDLPSNARVICYYRDGKFHHFDPSDKFEKGDEIIMMTPPEDLDELSEKFNQKENEGEPS